MRRLAFEIHLGGFLRGFLFALHVFVFDGVEDIATGLALDIFGVFIPGDDADNGVFAGREHGECVAGEEPDGCDFVLPGVWCQ